jgi:hypothetical protein
MFKHLKAIYTLYTLTQDHIKPFLSELCTDDCYRWDNNTTHIFNRILHFYALQINLPFYIYCYSIQIYLLL